ncbi:MFS transporter [Nocardia sp. NPDC052254]|uniref:MFS transporter n=1 Tax=Nocardia sp. NPDC052254 TaxID=3155681 RepID=UPI003448C232
MAVASTESATHGGAASDPDGRYQWTALANTTAAVFMAALDGSIVLIALPAIFRGIGLDPLAPGNIGFLLWMIMGYRLVQAVLVVPLGRLGDMFGRVRIYNAGFVVFTVASLLLSFDPLHGGAAAAWLIGWRVLQAVGGSMLTANSAAILTDAFPPDRRGFALGVNQIAGLAGMFIGLIAGGVLVLWDWRAVFWVNVPVGIFGTIWAYRNLRDITARGGPRPRVDWLGNISFTVGVSALLIAITEGIHPYGRHAMGWTNPQVIGLFALGAAMLATFVVVERRIREPMFDLGLFGNRTFTAANLAGFAARLAQGGLQFMLIIWLQGVWLPLHGYDYAETPLWAGIYLLPLTIGFLLAGPVSGAMSDRIGSRGPAVGGMLVFAASFLGLMVLPVDFPYWAFAVLIAANGIGMGAFSSPNSSAIMGSVPAARRGVASGMRSTFQNTGTALSIGVFFSLLIAGLSAALPQTLTAGLQQHGVPPHVAADVGSMPPVTSLFAAILGVDPIGTLLAPSGVLATLPADRQQALTGGEFFPQMIAGPFHHGLTVVFAVSAALGLLAAAASWLRSPGARTAEVSVRTRDTARAGIGTDDSSPDRSATSDHARDRGPAADR